MRRTRSLGLAALAAMLGLTGAGLRGAFVSPPGKQRLARVEAQSPSVADLRWESGRESAAGSAAAQDSSDAGIALALLAAAAGTGAASARGQLRREASGSTLVGRSTAAASSSAARHSTGVGAAKIDWLGTSTGWDDIETKRLGEIDLFSNVHGIFTISSVVLFAFQMLRIASHQSPSEAEVWATTFVYLPWTYFCWRDTKELEAHYQVTFYASCGWAILSLASLWSVVLQDKAPELSFDILAAGNVVFTVACGYFYSYHWGRMWRHFTQNRFRPLWIPGLLGLMCLHALTTADFVKRVDDGKWWKTVCTVYPDEWWWVADVRIIELFVTAAALWLIILHIQGVFTGMKNAAIVVFGTILLPLLVMAAESSWLRASAWQHYLMLGPKHW